MPGEPIECPQSWLDWQLYLWRDWDGEDDTCDLSESDCFGEKLMNGAVKFILRMRTSSTGKTEATIRKTRNIV